MLSLVRFFIRIYRCTFSPLLTLICGPGSGCRFTPTCSAYFLEAIETHGVADGTWLGLKRLARCHPWGGCGHDPVPVPEDRKSTRLNSSHRTISYAVFCLKKKKHINT